MLESFNNENYVAHYTKLETIVEYILPTNKLKISSIKEMNDPYENRQHWFENDGSAYNNEIEQYHQIQKLRNILFDSIKVFASTGYQENKNATGLSGHIYCHPRMWAQYGNNHKGICLIFNKKKLNTCFEKSSDIFKFYNDEVEYLEWIEIINSDFYVDYESGKKYIKNKNELFEEIIKNDFIKSRFFKKHNDWRDECEYRWLAISKKETDLFVDFGDSLEAIVLGCDVNPRYFSIFKECKIPVYYLKFTSKYDDDRLN